jgi:hypothetical protein
LQFLNSPLTRNEDIGLFLRFIKYKSHKRNVHL